jgi:hypothetical protein
VGEAGTEQALRERLEHDTHAHVDLAQRGEITLAHEARVGVGKEARFFRHELAHLSQVAEGRGVPHAIQELAVLGENGFGPVAEGEERFLGAEPLARPGEGENLLGRHGEGAGLPRIAPEGTVAAIVATEIGQGHEDLGRERHAAAPANVPCRRGGGEKVGEHRGAGIEEGDGVLERERAALPRPVQGG